MSDADTHAKLVLDDAVTIYGILLTWTDFKGGDLRAWMRRTSGAHAS